MAALPQHMEALGLANECRFARAALRREVAAMGGIDGRARLAQLVECPPPCIENMPVLDLLCWIRRVRELQARRILAGVRDASTPPVSIRDGRVLKTLAERERSALARYLAGERATESRWAA